LKEKKTNFAYLRQNTDINQVAELAGNAQKAPGQLRKTRGRRGGDIQKKALAEATHTSFDPEQGGKEQRMPERTKDIVV